MRPTFDDFTSKYGFRDGEAVDALDFRARKKIVGALNAHPCMLEEHARALEFDRPGFHNGCMILIVPNPGGVSDDELLKRAHTTADLRGLPDGIDIEAIVAEAYDELYEEILN